MHSKDILIFKDGTWKYLEECQEQLGHEIEVLFFGTNKYMQFLKDSQ